MAIVQKKTGQPAVAHGAADAKGMPIPGKETAIFGAWKGGIKLDVHELNQLIYWARIFMQTTVILMIISILVGIIAFLDCLGHALR